jgi:hypothetical protein
VLTADPVLALLLFLHIGGAVVAFGPNFAFLLPANLPHIAISPCASSNA